MARRISTTLTGPALAGFCCLAGIVIGILDFTLITPVPALLGVALCGWIVGRNSAKPWKSSIVLGFGVPLGVILMMALGGKPTRRHYVFIDARAAVICVAAAVAGQLLRDRSNGATPNGAVPELG